MLPHTKGRKHPKLFGGQLTSVGLYPLQEAWTIWICKTWIFLGLVSVTLKKCLLNIDWTGHCLYIETCLLGTKKSCHGLQDQQVKCIQILTRRLSSYSSMLLDEWHSCCVLDVYVDLAHPCMVTENISGICLVHLTVLVTGAPICCCMNVIFCNGDSVFLVWPEIVEPRSQTSTSLSGLCSTTRYTYQPDPSTQTMLFAGVFKVNSCLCPVLLLYVTFSGLHSPHCGLPLFY